MSNKIE